MKKTITDYDFSRAFKDMGRDYYSYYGYKAMYNFYEDIDPDMELDVIGICGEWTEYDDGGLEDDFQSVLSFDDWREENADI